MEPARVHGSKRSISASERTTIPDWVNVLQNKKMVGAPGFKPGTSCAQGRRAIKLRYAPTGVFFTP